MADSIERTIFKLEIDDSAYIKGVESLTASTNKLAQAQKAANDELKKSEAALKAATAEVEKNKKAFDDISHSMDRKFGDDVRALTAIKKSQEQEKLLTAEVEKNRLAYEAAKKAADDFNAASSKASALQPVQAQGKIPTATPIVPPVIQPTIDLENFDLADTLEKAVGEFEAMRVAVNLAKEEMNSLNAEDEEFKKLAPIVKEGEEALRLYDAAAEEAGQSTQSLRTQLRLGREELVKLEQQGKANTKEYTELEKHVAKLTDEFSDQQQRIRILASDTKLLDFGKASITAATSAFQTYASIQILVGEGNEELQKKTMQLFAAMQLLQSLEQLSNLTRREGQLATLAQAGAQSVYTAVVGASTGTLKAFRIALLATGIGAAIAAIGFLVIKYNEMRDATREAREEQKLLNDINKKAIEGFSQEVTRLELVKKKLDDLSIPQKERVKLAKEYNKTAEDANKIDLKQISNIDLVNAAIDRQIVKLKQRAIARAAEAVIGEKAEAFFKQQVEFEERFPQFSDKTIAELDKKASDIIEIRKKALGIKDKVDNKEILAFADLPKEQLEKLAANNERFKILLDDQAKQRLTSIAKQQADIQKARTGADVLNAQGAATSQALLTKAKEDFDRALKIGAELIGSEDLIDEKTAGDKIENVFEQERLKLTAQLAELRNKEITDLKKINDQFAAKLLVEKKRIEDLIKDKKITGSIADEKSQAGILFKLAVEINDTERDKAIADFNKKITDARKKLNDELRDLQEKNIQDQLNLIQDEFERRAALIDFNKKKELSDQKEATEERIAALNLDRLLIGEQAYQDAKANIIDEGERAAQIILQKYAIERQDLAAASFKKILDAYQSAISAADLIRDEGIAQQIRNVSDRFLAGKISYEQFQKEITKIQKDAEATRRNATLETQRNELQALDRQIEQTLDKTSKEYKDLIKLRDDLRGKIAAGEKEDAEKDAEEGKPGEDPRTKRILSYVDSIGQLAASVIGFWEKANEAESKALDRSIALQEKRVDAARRIAERGNAEYLKAEEDRLTELQIKRENAARRQLAIDAAIQGSQILVGITGAIAKIATPGIGAAETIAEIAVIVGALATGYGLVKSLQGNQPKLAKGDPYVRRGNNPAGTDTIPAWLNEGEAIIPTDTNKAYHPTVQAIYHKKVPAEDINRFVQNYHRLKPVPQVNHERIKNAAELHIDSSGKMAVAISEQNKLLMENNDLQRATIRAIRSIKNEVSLDEKGFAVSFMSVIEQMEIDNNT